MTTLPSFVELMATLGLDPVTRMPGQGSPHSSPLSSPKLLGLPTSSPTRSRSSPSLRGQTIQRSKVARYSPYSSTFLAPRRGSTSSSSSSSPSPELERLSLRAYSTSPQPPRSPRLRRRVDNKLTVNVFESTSDLSANTPISSFVRRKTPGVSPISPTFSMDSTSESPAGSPMPFTLPTLPSFFPRSASSDSFPLTPQSDIVEFAEHSSPDCKTALLPDIADIAACKRPQRTGIRISTPPASQGKQRSIMYIV
ncbi:hypothetical protein C8J56DRAFT_1047443 [Mycena floridula]|nr:hypothetical protein C8J56DRAFT_1047443 [Mycena floridula]